MPEYNLGAMENPGLVTFTESYVFTSRAADSQYQARANTLLHEMAHMWFGDLVTMQWWDDLWLKESFADYMGTLGVDRTTDWDTAWVNFANNRKAWAYVQDQLPTTHPIVADIPDLEAAKQNFDGITYAKGAVGAQAARGLCRVRGVHRRLPAVLPGPRLRQHHPGRPAGRPERGLRPRPGRTGPANGCRPPASRPSPPRSTEPTTASSAP